MKIPVPNYTMTPNEVFDHWLPLLGEGELKVLMVIMRKTFGWHKTHDEISISQLSKKTGMLEESVLKAAKSLKNKGVITRKVIGENGTQRTIYSLVITDDSNKSYPSVLTPRSEPPPPGLNPPVKTEAQKKASSYKETTTAKERKLAAAVFLDEDKEKSKKPAVYAILETVDILDTQKIKLTRIFDEETVINAIGWATHPTNPPRKSLAASITYACNDGLSIAEFEKKNKTPYEMVCERFEDGKKYNDARCCLKKDGISFTRTMKYGEVKFDKFFKWEKLIELCESFGISFNFKDIP